MAVSGSGAVLLFALYTFEDRRQRRFGSGLRLALDAVTTRVVRQTRRHLVELTTYSGRIGLHYVLHHLLRKATLVAKWLAAYLHALQQRNHQIARSARVARANTHLSAIATHKKATALSNVDRIDRKEKSLAG